MLCFRSRPPNPRPTPPVDEGAQFRDRHPGVSSLWEEDIPWGRLAVTSMTVRHDACVRLYGMHVVDAVQ